MSTRLNRSIKGLRAFSITDNTVAPGVLQVLDVPTSPTIDPGIAQEISQTQNEIGEITTSSVQIIGQQPVLTVTFPKLTPQVLALRQGRRLKAVTAAEFDFERTFRVTKNAYDPVITGQFGFGMPADQVGSTASVIGPLGEAVPLTRLASAGFDPVGTTDSFAQAENGGFLLSDNLIGSDVSIKFPHSEDGLEVSEDLVTELAISMLAIMTDGTIMKVAIGSVIVDYEASGDIPVGNGSIALAFRPTDTGVSCVPIEYRFINQVVAC